MNDGLANVYCGLTACRSDSDGVELNEVVLAPDGEVKSKCGTFFVDAESGRLIAESIRAHDVELPIDYEHGTMGPEWAGRDGTAPAAGWIKAVRYEPGRGLVATVEWTERARAFIRAKEYLYLSPVLKVRKTDRKAIDLHSAALTNKPAIPSMEMLAAKEHSNTEKQPMAGEPAATTASPDLLIGRIAEKLDVSLEGKTDVLEMLQAIYDAIPEKGDGSKKDDAGEGEGTGTAEDKTVASKAVLTALKLETGAEESAVLVAINSLRQGSGDVTGLRTELDAVKGELADRRVEDLIQPQLDANTINPHDADDMKVCRELARNNPKLFAHMMAKRPAYAEPGRTNAPAGGAGGNSREMIIAKATQSFGNDPDIGRLTSKAAWVGEKLREAELDVLTDDERKKLG